VFLGSGQEGIGRHRFEDARLPHPPADKAPY
jgi:hypothetical protein